MDYVICDTSTPAPMPPKPRLRHVGGRNGRLKMNATSCGGSWRRYSRIANMPVSMPARAIKERVEVQ